MGSSQLLKRGVRALAILLCVGGVTVSAAIMWGFWPSLMTFCASYGLVCIADGLETDG